MDRKAHVLLRREHGHHRGIQQGESLSGARMGWLINPCSVQD